MLLNEIDLHGSGLSQRNRHIDRARFAAIAKIDHLRVRHHIEGTFKFLIYQPIVDYFEIQPPSTRNTVPVM